MGTVKILDTTYQEIHTVGLENSSFDASGAYLPHIDLHEGMLTLWGSILVIACNSTPYDLSSFGGPENHQGV